MYELYPDCYERVMPTAFDRALREKDDVRCLYNHSPDAILGRSSAGTLRLTVDSTGLRYDVDPPDSDAGHRVVEGVKRTDITGSSFSFDAEDITWRDVEIDGKRCQVREINSVRLYDVGPVVYPAYEGTSVDIRSDREKWKRGKTAPLSARLALVRARAVMVPVER